MTTGAPAGGGGSGGGDGSGGGSVSGNVGGSADAYRQSSSASPRGVVTGGGYCGSSASTPHSHSTNGSYSVANPYTGSPTLYTSRKYLSLFPQATLCMSLRIHKIQVVPRRYIVCRNYFLIQPIKSIEMTIITAIKKSR